MTDGRWDTLQRITDPIGWLRNMLARWGLEWFAKRFYGVYPGIVIDNKDPEGRGRIRPLIPALGMKTENHVGKNYWADASMTGLGTDPKTKQMTGQFHPPDIGTNVWVLFQFGDTKFPVYIGGFITLDNASDTFSSEDALKKGIRTRTGHFLRMNDDPEDLNLMIGKGDGDGGPSPTFISMSKEGHFQASNDQGSSLFMNAVDNEVSLTCGKVDGETVEALSFFLLKDDEISMATKSGGAFGIKKKNISIVADNFVANCAQQFSADAGTVMLGKGASEPAIRGMRLVQWALLHQHTQGPPVPGTPTVVGPVPPPMLYNELSEKVFIA